MAGWLVPYLLHGAAEITLDGKPGCSGEQEPPTSFPCPSGRGYPPFPAWRRVRPPELLSASPFSASWLHGCRAVRLWPSFVSPHQVRFSTLPYRARRGDFQPHMATLTSFPRRVTENSARLAITDPGRKRLNEYRS